MSALLGGITAGDAGRALRIEFAPPSALFQHTTTSGKALAPATAGSVASIKSLSGTWVKDKKQSDSLDPVLRMMHVKGLIRQAIRLVKGVNIHQSDTALTIEVFSVIGWFKVVERYPFNGAPAMFRRRDLRRGQHTGKFLALPPLSVPRSPPRLWPFGNQKQKQQQQQQQQQQEASEQQQPGRFAIDLTWGEPFGGTGMDVYQLIEPDLLQVVSTIKVGDQEVQNRAVFHRKK